MNTVRAVLIEFLSGRAEAGSGIRVVGEVAGPIGLGTLLRMRLVVERIRQGFVLRLILDRSSRFLMPLSAIRAGMFAFANDLRLVSEW